MATGTLERATEVVVEDAPKAVSVTDAAKGESRAKVSGDAAPGTARAWNARAQFD